MAELLDLIDKDTHPFAEMWERFFEQVKETPENYSLSRIGEKSHVREISTHDIPEKGRVVRYTDNEGYDLQDPQFKKRFPELDTEGHAAVVEIVEDASLLESGTKEKLKIGIYLIKETE